MEADHLADIIFTNKSEKEIHLYKGEIIGCAEYCYSAIQIDPNVTINSAPVSSLLLIINSIVLSSHPDSQENTNSWSADDGFQLPSPEMDNDSPIYLSLISVGNDNADDRKFVEHLRQQFPDVISKSQWDLRLFKTEPAHISIKSGFSPKFIRQPAILDPTIREVSLKMLQELENRGFIKKCNSDWSSPLIVLRKSPREYKIGSVKTSGSLCKIPGLKRTKWDEKAGLRFVISLKHLNQATKPKRD